MRVLVDGKPRHALTAEDESYINMYRKEDKVEGSVLSADDATNAYIRQTKLLFVILGCLTLVLTFALALLAEDRDQAAIFGVAIIVNLALAAFLAFLLKRRVRIWREKLAWRVTGLAPIGTRIVVDVAGLTVADRTSPWPALRIDQVELNEFTTRRTTTFFIERLSLADADGVVVLDAAMLQNGRLIVGNSWRRLRPPAS